MQISGACASLAFSSCCLKINSLVISIWQLLQKTPSIFHSGRGLYLWPNTLSQLLHRRTSFFPNRCKFTHLVKVLLISGTKTYSTKISTRDMIGFGRLLVYTSPAVSFSVITDWIFCYSVKLQFAVDMLVHTLFIPKWFDMEWFLYIWDFSKKIREWHVDCMSNHCQNTIFLAHSMPIKYWKHPFQFWSHSRSLTW